MSTTLKNNPANTPEPNPINQDDNEPVLWDLVIKDFEKMYLGDKNKKAEIIQFMRNRDLFGYTKYSCHLKINNGRSFINDALQETGDLVVYTKGLSEENPGDDLIMEFYKDSLFMLARLYSIKKFMEANG